MKQLLCSCLQKGTAWGTGTRD